MNVMTATDVDFADEGNVFTTDATHSKYLPHLFFNASSQFHTFCR